MTRRLKAQRAGLCQDVLCRVAAIAVTLGLSSLAHAESFRYPLSVAASSDRVYVADRDLPGVWSVEDGKATVYFRGSKKLKTPLNAIRCVAIDADGKLLAGDSATRDVHRFDDAGVPQPLTGGGIGIPMAIAVDDAGDLFVADLELHRVVRVPAKGGTAELFVRVPAPRGLAFDANGRLWIVSHGPNQVVRADKNGKIDTVVAGRRFRFPHNIVLNKSGEAFVADGYAKTIWRIPVDGEPAAHVAGEPFSNPVGLAVRSEDGTLLVADPGAGALIRVGEDKAAAIEPMTFPSVDEP